MSANVAPTIAFKVQLQRRDREPVFHRFSGSYNFSELSTVISHLWGERPKHLVLDYTDDEGDQCRVTSEAEWEECVRIFQSSNIPVLRLTGKRAKDEKGSKRKNKRETSAEESGSESEQEVAEERLNEKRASSVPSLPDIQRHLQEPFNMEPLCKAASSFIEAALGSVSSSQPPSQPTSVNLRDQVPASSTKKREAPKVECDANSAAVDLMSLMYNCDAGVELFRGATEQFGSVVKRLVNPFAPTEVHLDIDRSVLYRDVVTKGNAMIDAVQLPQAEQLLRTALVVFQDSVILEYNLACVMSLQERLDEAIELLLAARAHGYDDIHQLTTDTDLANVRKHPRFAEVVPSAAPTVVEPEPEAPVVESTPDPAHVAPEVVPVPQEVAPQVPVPAAPAAPVDPQVLTLLSIFPDMTVDEADLALRRAEGNMSRAVNARLSGN